MTNKLVPGVQFIADDSTGNITGFRGVDGSEKLFAVTNADQTLTGTQTFTTIAATTVGATSVNATNIDAGASGTAGTLDIFPSTASRGKATYDITNQTGDTTVTHRTAAMGQATVITTPDPGASTASVILSAGNQTVGGIKTFSSTIVQAVNTGSVGGGTISISSTGTGRDNLTTLTLTNTPVTIGDNAALAVGVLVWTMPAGRHVIEWAHVAVGLTLAGTPTTDTPEVALGTTIGSGANATIGAVGAGAENILEGIAMADIAGTVKVAFDMPNAASSTPLYVATGDAHTVYLNFAATWADVTATAATVSGTVMIKWTVAT